MESIYVITTGPAKNTTCFTSSFNSVLVIRQNLGEEESLVQQTRLCSTVVDSKSAITCRTTRNCCLFILKSHLKALPRMQDELLQEIRVLRLQISELQKNFKELSEWVQFKAHSQQQQVHYAKQISV